MAGYAFDVFLNRTRRQAGPFRIERAGTPVPALRRFAATSFDKLILRQAQDEAGI